MKHSHYKRRLVFLPILCLIVLNGFSRQQAFAQKARIHLFGNVLPMDSTINRLNATLSGVPISDSLLQRVAIDLMDTFHHHGFVFAAVDSICMRTDSLHASHNLDVFLSPGEKFVVSEVYQADTAHDRTTQERLRAPVLFTASHIQALMHRLLQPWLNRGYPFVSIRVDSLRNDGNRVRLFISTHPGPLVTIRKINVLGNRNTRDYVIIREMRLKPGSIYRQSEIDRIPERLQRLDYIKQVKPPQIVINKKGEGELIVSIKDNNVNKLDGVIGYQPGEQNRPGYFTGLVDIRLGNIMGTARQLDAYWERKNRTTQELRLRYLEPWVMGKPVHLGGRLEQLVQDTSFVKRNYLLELLVPLSDEVELFAHGGRELVLPDSIGTVVWNLPRSKSWLLNLGFRYDIRNHKYNPRKGVYYETAVEFARKQNESSSESPVFERKRIRMNAEILVPTWQWQTISVALHWRRLQTNEPGILLSDLFRLGGSQTLRGYREDEFIGSDISWINLEYRYLLSELSRAFVFVDVGYFARPAASGSRIKGYRSGYGFGMRLDTRLGIVGIDYGLGEGRGLATGLLHVRLVSQF